MSTGNGSKPTLALYWAASCGGCEIAILELYDKVLDVADAFDIVFWPVAMDVKYADVEAMEAGSIDLCLFNGAIRTSENEHLAHMMREKAKVLVAFGSCSGLGGIPGLANTTSLAAILERVYATSPSTDANGRPQTSWDLPEGTVSLPEMYESVRTLDDVVAVDYYVPGCPPESHQIWAVVEAVTSGAELPPPGSVIGAGDRTVCEECLRTRTEKSLTGFVRPHQILPDPEVCLLDQGIVCMGPATRSGCGGLCVAAGSPCRGCYGPAPNAVDQGANMMKALATVVAGDDAGEVAAAMDQIADPIGTFYRFGLPASTLRRVQI
jgi:F420-non-reducing hydrogenase small subunit